MPVILKLNFPAGRYHATPWGHHVNEGVAEWPPSPWRLLRALIATWKRKCPQLSETAVRRLLEQLVGPPLFRLPPSCEAHTRHYMPWEKKGPADRTLIFDTFVVVNRGDPLYVGWPEVTLAEEDRQTLGELAKNLTCLGRAESWVEAALTEAVPAGWSCVPAGAAPGELVSVFCADPATAFGSEYYPAASPKKPKKRLAPEDHLFDCPPWHLCLDTEVIHKQRWARVPGARWVSYARSADAATAAPQRERLPTRPGPSVARFSLDGPALPLITETVAVAEAFRSQLLARYRQVVRRRLGLSREARPETHPELCSRALSGKEGGRMVHGSHDHAYYLPTDEDHDGRVDHVTVLAEGGLSEDEVSAVDIYRKLRWAEGELRLQLVGLGAAASFRCPLFDQAAVWESATPFVVNRHVKKRGQKKDPPGCYGQDGRRAFAVRVLKEEVARLAIRRPDLPAADSVEVRVVERVGQGVSVRPLEFRRGRNRAGDDGMRRAAIGARLTFPAPVPGPFCLGYAAHFGLGLFVPRG